MNKKPLRIVIIIILSLTIILTASYFLFSPTKSGTVTNNTNSNQDPTVTLIKDRIEKLKNLSQKERGQKLIQPDELVLTKRLKENYNLTDQEINNQINKTKTSNPIIAIFDSGIDTRHSELVDSVIYEECFSSSNDDFEALCNNSNKQDEKKEVVKSSSCNILQDIDNSCSHGTKVASLINGKYSLSPNAKTISFAIYSLRKSDKSIFIQPEDFKQALIKLNYLSDNGIPIKALNLSWNTKEMFTKDCNTEFPEVYELIEKLKSKKVITFVSSGNDSQKGKVPYPACLSNTINIASLDNGEGDTTKDQISDFSNHLSTSNLNTKFANGRYITTAIPSEEDKNSTSLEAGTSFATPLVTSAYINCLDQLSTTKPEKCLNNIFEKNRLVIK